MTCCETKDSIDFFEIIKWITPVLLFFLGLFFNKLSERLKENRRLEKVESYFYELLYSLKSLISQEQDLIMDCKNRLNDWSENDITLNQSSSRVLERILEIRQEDLFKIFVQRKKGARDINIKDYKDLNIIIDHLAITLPYILTANKEQVEAINTFRNNWNSSQMAIIHFHNELISLYFGSTDEKFIEGFNDLVKSFNNDTKKTKNIEQTIQNLIDPLINLCKSHSDDLRATKLMTMLVESKLAYKEIKHIRESEVKDLMTVDAGLKANQIKLEDLIIKMKSKKNYGIIE